MEGAGDTGQVYGFRGGVMFERSLTLAVFILPFNLSQSQIFLLSLL